MKLPQFLQNISTSRLHLSQRNFFLLLSVVVGVVAALAAVALKEVTHGLEALLEIHKKGTNYTLLIFPVIGIFLATLYT